MILTCFRRCRRARLLRCTHAYHWPVIRIGRCWYTSSATRWVSPSSAGNPELGRESTTTLKASEDAVPCQRIGEQRQQLPILEEQAGTAMSQQQQLRTCALAVLSVRLRPHEPRSCTVVVHPRLAAPADRLRARRECAEHDGADGRLHQRAGRLSDHGQWRGDRRSGGGRPSATPTLGTSSTRFWTPGRRRRSPTCTATPGWRRGHSKGNFPGPACVEIRAELGSLCRIDRLRECSSEQLTAGRLKFMAWSCLPRRPAD